jgi:mRNA interferase RelE/StbE
MLHPKAAEFLDKSDTAKASRIKKRLIELKDDPVKLGKGLRYTDYWSLRIGDYRAIYLINEAEKQVVVLFIGNRKNVYDDFSKLF